jgi:glucosyl-3-phosphoglycerate synthase
VPPRDTVAVVAARDEADRLPYTLQALSRIPTVSRIFVVDDGSRDATAKLAGSHNATVLTASAPGHPGDKGRALLTGLSRARALYPEAVLLSDADLGESATELEALLQVLSPDHPLTIAAFPPARGGGFGLVKSLASRAIERRTGYAPREPLSGQRALLPSALGSLPGIAPGFGAEVGMTLDLLSVGIKPLEVPVPLSHRPTGKTFSGFAHRARQGLDILRALRGSRHPW